MLHLGEVERPPVLLVMTTNFPPVTESSELSTWKGPLDAGMAANFAEKSSSDDLPKVAVLRLPSLDAMASGMGRRAPRDG